MDELIYSTGFGIVPKKLMQDPNLSLQAKGVFSYLATYANRDGDCFPSRELMCSHLNISKDTITKYIKELKEAGYLEVEQVKNGGKFSHNVYHLSPYPKNKDTVITDTQNSPLTIPVINNTNNNINSTSKEKQTPKNDKQLEQAEKLWQLYPNKKGKTRAIKDIRKHMKNYTYEQLENAVKAYATEVAGRDKQYIKHGSTFFKDGILDYLEADGPEKEEPRDAAINKADEEYFTKLMMEQLNPDNKL